MSDINETLLNYYEEALDMGMTEDDAKVWAWDKLNSNYQCRNGWREQMSFVDLQKVLWNSYDIAIDMGMTDEDARVWALNKVTETSQQFVKEYKDE